MGSKLCDAKAKLASNEHQFSKHGLNSNRKGEYIQYILWENEALHTSIIGSALANFLVPFSSPYMAMTLHTSFKSIGELCF